MQPDASRDAPVSIAPSESDLEVCVIDRRGEVHGLIFPCRKNGRDWVDAVTKGGRGPRLVGQTGRAGRVLDLTKSRAVGKRELNDCGEKLAAAQETRDHITSEEARREIPEILHSFGRGVQPAGS
jgi:hypothetical protein